MCDIKITFSTDENTQKPITLLNGTNVEDRIRTLEVSQYVSPVAALDFVRTALIEQQREMGKSKGIVMDGRDIGTTVFPDAELKIFVTAGADVRARRRYDELMAKGENPNYDEILANVVERDRLDQTREVSPLRKADDALLLDNSNMTIDGQLQWLCEEYKKRIEQ
jgi:cytidylate kinase